MSRERNESINLNKISWSFREVCKIAKEIKPNNWCIIESNDKIAFIEIKLPHTGPAVLQKQLILSNYLQLEIFIGSGKLSNKVFDTNSVASVADLKNCIEILGSLIICLGNRNFRKTNRSTSSESTQYWRHSQCLLVYKKDNSHKERCCDSCLTLNCFIPKQKGFVIAAVEDDDDEDEEEPYQPSLKKVAGDINQSLFNKVKEEITN